MNAEDVGRVIGGILTIGFGVCIIIFPHILNWLVGGAIVITGIIFIFAKRGKDG